MGDERAGPNLPWAQAINPRGRLQDRDGAINPAVVLVTVAVSSSVTFDATVTSCRWVAARTQHSGSITNI